MSQKRNKRGAAQKPIARTDRLLAKSVPVDEQTNALQTPWPHGVFLIDHITDVYETARALCASKGTQILEQVALEPDTWLARLERALPLAALLHDLGKANDRFQAMVKNERSPTAHQPVRHEAISVYMALHPKLLCSALFPEGDVSQRPVEACAVIAVLGHHVKYSICSAQLQPGVSDPLATGDIEILCDHPDLAAILAREDLAFAEGAPASIVLDRDALLDDLEECLETLDPFLIEMDGAPFASGVPDESVNTEWGRFLALIKALLISCDVIGSALVRVEEDDSDASQRSYKQPHEWLRDAVLNEVATKGALQEVIDRRLGDKHTIRPFQDKIAAGGASRRVVVAGCGSGKTLGAYVWAQRFAEGRKLFFCYPTTGTATEGFGDYVMDSRTRDEPPRPWARFRRLAGLALQRSHAR